MFRFLVLIPFHLMGMLHCYAYSPPEMKNAEDCLEWFRFEMLDVHKNYACLGSASMSCASEDGFFEIDWFEVGKNDGKSEPSRYVETRQPFAITTNADVWEKALWHNKVYMGTLGSYNRKLIERKLPEFDEKGKFLGGTPFSMEVPAPFILSVLDNNAYRVGCWDSPDFRKFLGQLKVLESQTDDGKIVGFFLIADLGIEITFEKKVGWMPTRCRHYYRNAGSSNPPTREQYSKLQCEVETNWTCVDEANGTYVPTKVRNVIYLKNRKTKRVTEMEMNVRWLLGKCNVDDFTLDSANKVIDNTGPFGVLKKELLGQRVDAKLKKEQGDR